MSVLKATIHKRSQINTVKLFLEVYFVINEHKFQQRDDLMVLAYYCLFGTSKKTDELIRQEYARYKTDPKSIKHALHHARYRLKNLGVMIKDPYTLELSLHQDLKDAFSNKERLGWALNFTFDEEEPGE